MFSTEGDVDLLDECGYLKNDLNRLCIEFKKKHYWNEIKIIWISLKVKKNRLLRKF